MMKKWTKSISYASSLSAIIATFWLLIHFNVFDHWLVVSEITVNGNSYADSRQLIEKSGIKLGSDLYKLNLDSCSKEILKLAYVKGVTISRFFPNNIIINITEYNPIASVWNKDRWFLISEEGIALPLVKELDLGKVPILSGMSLEREVMGSKISSKNLIEAFGLLKKLYTTNPVTYGYSGEVNFSDFQKIRIYLMKGNMQLILPKNDYENSLAKLKIFVQNSRHLDYLVKSKYIDLCYKDRIIIKKA